MQQTRTEPVVILLALTSQTGGTQVRYLRKQIETGNGTIGIFVRPRTYSTYGTIKTKCNFDPNPASESK